ncbi:MAG: GNAT family N-acetyltransferase [Cytophagia bacterium]|nr:GNAT family N-acetyltransferase [Cytophagia bacterium]
MFIKEITPEETWPIRQLVMWPQKPIEFVKIKGDESALHYGLYIDNRLTSVVSCFEIDNEIQFRKFATLSDKQNNGFGTTLLNYIIRESRSKGIKKLWCNSRMNKAKYYEKFGLVKTDTVYLKDGIEFIIMELKFD